MKAIQVSQVGGPEVLKLVELPIPEPKPNEALVQIKAAGVNFIDVYFREGRYPAPLPFINGQEAAGIVTAAGANVINVKVGNRVAYTGALGSYAEYAAVPADRLVKIPDQLDFNQAAAAMLQGMTAHYLSHSTYPIKAGETALVHAAAGGVGLLLVQMCKLLGARVIGTAGSEEKARDGNKALGICDLCGGDPACVKACPEQCLSIVPTNQDGRSLAAKPTDISAASPQHFPFGEGCLMAGGSTPDAFLEIDLDRRRHTILDTDLKAAEAFWADEA